MTKAQARQKAKELVAKMTVVERLSQLVYNSPAIERLGIDEYNWWNEGSHGVARAGTATVFPHAIAMGATFDPDLVGEVADAISTEGRAKYNKHVKYGDHDMPDFEDYSMKGRTYRYIEGDALYPFGFGLSYTNYKYDNAKLVSADGEKITVSAEVENAGGIDGKEIVQVYAAYTDSRVVTPHWQLCSLKSVNLEADEKKEITLDIDRYWVKAVNLDGERVDPDGKITLYIGGHQPDSVSDKLLGYPCLKIEV